MKLQRNSILTRFSYRYSGPRALCVSILMRGFIRRMVSLDATGVAIVLLFASIVTGFCQVPAMKVNYFCEGVGSWTNFSLTGVSASGMFQCRADISNCVWTIKTIPIPIEEDYRLVTYDGSNMYYLCSLETDVRNIKPTDPKGLNVAGGSVWKTSVPNLAAYHCTGPTWLASASECYFSTVTGSNLDLCCGMWTMSGENIYPSLISATRRANWKLDDKLPYLPASIIWYEDGEAVNVKFDRYTRVKYPPPYDNGFTNTTYLVREWTNFAGLHLPTDSEIVTYGRLPIAKSPKQLWVRQVYSINWTNFGNGAKLPSFPPTVPGITTVNDGRFMKEVNSKIPFEYNVDSGRFYTDEEVRNLPEYANAYPARIHYAGVTRTTYTPRVFVAIILIISIFPILTVLKPKKKRE